MVFVKHNSLKSDIFFNPIFIPGFSGSVSRVRVQGPGPGSKVQGPGSGFRSSLLNVIMKEWFYHATCFGVLPRF